VWKWGHRHSQYNSQLKRQCSGLQSLVPTANTAFPTPTLGPYVNSRYLLLVVYYPQWNPRGRVWTTPVQEQPEQKEVLICRVLWCHIASHYVDYVTGFIVSYEGVSKSFRTESITKYTPTTINTHWEATQRVMAAKLTRLTHKISDTTAPSGRKLYHLEFSFQAVSPETFGYVLVSPHICSTGETVPFGGQQAFTYRRNAKKTHIGGVEV
jgi:hypothetical protein